MSIFKKIEEQADKTKKESFKTVRRYRKKSLVGNNRKSIAIDDFGNPLRATDDKTKCKTISLTLPKQLIAAVDKKRGSIPRSRYFREMVEYCMDLELNI